MSRVETLLSLALIVATLLPTYVGGSEFPERECCDPVYPIPEPTSRAPSAPTPTGRSGPNIKTAVAILNCLFARQLCFEDPSCSAILEIIPRVCGPELVACSTVTVTKCQAALKTLQAFPFFRPTCLCREPHVDPECNSFRDFLFDHPCVYVLKKDKDPYPIDALPTCNHALSVCQRGKTCTKLFEDFKTNCKARDGKCRMENRDACHDAWTQLRLSPMFGCICPNNHMKRRCDRIFSMVNHNPCVEFLPSASVDLSGTDSALYPFDPQQENFQEFWFPPTSMYPYFLFPATASTRTFKEHERYHEVPEVPRQENGISFRKPVKGNDPDPDRGQHGPDGQSHGNRAHYGRGGEEKSTRPQEEQHSNQNSVDVEGGLLSKHGLPGTEHRHLSKSEHDHQHHVYEHQNRLHHQHNYSHRHHSLAPHPTPTVDESPPPLQDHVAPAPGHQGKKFAPRPTYEHRALVEDMDDLDDNELRLGKLPIDRLFDLQEAFEGFVDQVKVISHPDNSTSFELIESQLENPLIDADHQDLHALKQLPLPGLHHQRVLHGKNHSLLEDHGNSGSPLIIPSPVSDAEKAAAKLPVMLTLTSTCHHAYTSCKNDADCRRAMQPVLSHCDLASCARNACMDALQNFYKSASQKHSMEIAFCLCKKTDSNRDDCILAQEKMHPLCAQRVEGAEMPTCHSLAEICREDRACRTRLEYYEQSCAVDSVTKKCAGAPAECRKAMIGILGTDLRSNCACKGTDFTQLYDCLGWQRLLWVNPCVVESQKDYHARRKHHHQRTTTTPVTSTGTTSTMTSVVKPEQVNLIPEVTQKPLTEATEVWEISTEVSTTESTTMSSTTPPRFCVVQRPRQTHQYIREGRGKRLYRDDEPECSELCQCGIGEVLVCNTICVESSPCKTDFAFYNHAAPAYQAYRGRCLCYSGRFICMRPSPDSYSIPHGVFMFLGYSEADESLLRPHSNLTVMDAVSSLDHFMRQEVNNQTVCTLFLYNVTRENVIAAARLGNDNAPLNGSQASNLQHLLRIKEECSSMLQELSDKINNRHHELHSHPLLSIFKMAEVEIKLPQSSKGRTTRMTNDLLILALIASFLMAWDSGHFMLMGSTLQTDACNHRS